MSVLQNQYNHDKKTKTILAIIAQSCQKKCQNTPPPSDNRHLHHDFLSLTNKSAMQTVVGTLSQDGESLRTVVGTLSQDGESLRTNVGNFPKVEKACGRLSAHFPNMEKPCRRM